MNYKLYLIFCLFLLCVFVSGDSLWSPDFKGYLSSGKTLKPGDIILVKISSKTSLAFLSSSNDNKYLTLEFTGGEYGNLLSFLPSIKTSGNSKLKGDEEIKLESEIVAVVKSIDENNNAYLEGSRNIEIDGKGESLLLTGTVSSINIDSSKRVDFTELANPRLIFKTFITPVEKILNSEDIIQAIAQLNTGTTPTPETPPVTEPAPGITELSPSPLPESNTSGTTYSLSEIKKKELLLQYINKLIDLIFQ